MQPRRRARGVAARRARHGDRRPAGAPGLCAGRRVRSGYRAQWPGSGRPRRRCHSAPARRRRDRAHHPRRGRGRLQPAANRGDGGVGGVGYFSPVYDRQHRRDGAQYGRFFRWRNTDRRRVGIGGRHHDRRLHAHVRRVPRPEAFARSGAWAERPRPVRHLRLAGAAQPHGAGRSHPHRAGHGHGHNTLPVVLLYFDGRGQTVFQRAVRRGGRHA